MHQLDHFKGGLDAISVAAIIGSLMNWLPPIAAFLGIVWYCLQIYGWFEKRLAKKRAGKRRATDL